MSEPALPDAKYLMSLVNNLERFIQESEEKTKLILASLPVGLILVSDDGCIDVANRIVQDLFGYKRAQLHKKPVTFLFPNLKLDSIEGTVEKFGKRFNGEDLPVQLSTAEVPTPEGKRTFLFVSDISERYKMEKLKREFISMISHDLRAPLANVSAMIELLLAGKYGNLNDEGSEQLGKAEKSLNRVIGMISDLIEVEKLEADNMLIEPTVNNLTVTVEEAVADVARLAESKEIAISSFEENVFAQFDNEKIHRVLVNLLSNAVKFSPEKSIITVRLKHSFSWIELSVTDCGRGVPEADREKIFSKYHQVEKDDERVKGGAGLGLAICKSIVEAHGGAIGVRDNESSGKGSCFWFTIPSIEE